MSFITIRENKMLAKISEFAVLEEKSEKNKKKKEKNNKGATKRLNSLSLFSTKCRYRFFLDQLSY